MNEQATTGRQVLLQGNEAMVEGALAAGCTFFAGYPITPATEISEVMSVKLPAVGGTFVQMEDEIASMGAIIGASLAGAKSMTATSGPGFSLMQENLGFACVAEVPCVVVNVMRGGPSTGLPTNVSQADVMQARWGTHGDHPIIVLAVSTTKECFDITVKAFNLAEKYRTPVIILSDEVVGHTREKISLPHPGEIEVIDRIRPNMPPEWYVPYEDNSRGVPPMGIFGDGYRYHVTGLVHDVRGFPTQRPDEIVPFLNRIHRKISQHFFDILMVDEELTEDAEILVVAYGSVARSARRAVREARERGVKAGMMQLITLWPFPRQILEPYLSRVKAVLVPELNMGQVSREVKRINQGATRVETINRIDGNLITPEEILVRLIKM
ncbi:2-oxoglutarate ferredoxin oxidoreductase, alpha subunit [Desulfacinum hydrothermale DSM 13146]|uniref:2-oxoglutarate ferredoxin oxidoreductase, alpha subunit n=1 Tax=Desulfacinum hydrothermale DSM 13146 TaxID=1121390 RepID=A0A1W1XPY6_9BACT|nr:2-oxoacid:acceptor oxidoreductase subunit alpha [Desulfacinum hydrothermale]SMC26060.1 2-oxoglutarate ferredoxin oxidoreductase, alpha subunit [Desulfacinum hydrothermale DSM 13146]